MHLEELAPSHARAFLDMLEDYRLRDTVNYAALFGNAIDATEFGFLKFVKQCEQQRMDWRPKAGKTSVTRYVLLDNGGRICGNGCMRFPLSQKIEAEGGNLIFDVPPSLRRQGYGALTLNRMLFEAVRAGMARVLVTCSAENIGARRAIEANRGELEDHSPTDGRLHYWIRLR